MSGEEKMKRVAIVAGAAAVGLWIAAGVGCGPFEYQEWPGHASGGSGDGGTAGAGGFGGATTSGTGTACSPGEKRVCYTGPPEKAGIGACKSGTENCNADGSGFGPCEGEVLPTAEETCGDATDDDCDGIVDPPRSCLTNRGLLARYFINEAASGTDPTELIDSAESPENIPVILGGTLHFSSNDGHRSLRRGDIGNTSLVSLPLTQASKLRQLEGSRTGTIEIVTKVEEFNDYSRLTHLGDDGNLDCGTLTLRMLRPATINVCVNSDDSARFPVDLIAEGRMVVHLVMNTTAPIPPEPLKLYINGKPMTATTSTTPSPIDIPNTAWYSLGIKPNGSNQFKGNIYYAALYQSALDEEEVQTHAAVLMNDDDALVQP